MLNKNQRRRESVKNVLLTHFESSAERVTVQSVLDHCDEGVSIRSLFEVVRFLNPDVELCVRKKLYNRNERDGDLSKVYINNQFEFENENGNVLKKGWCF